MTVQIIPSNCGWFKKQGLEPNDYNCGFCGNKVSSVLGYKAGANKDGSGNKVASIVICPHCGGPTFIDMNGNHLPDVAFGSAVAHVPEKLNAIYDEARKCTSNSAYTAAILLCRKILMHIGVEQGAEEGKNFIFYVDYLSEQGYVPPNGSIGLIISEKREMRPIMK